MMKYNRMRCVLGILLLLCVSLLHPVWAASEPNASRTGSITVEIRDMDTGILQQLQAEMNLYHLAGSKEEGAFYQADFDLANITAEEEAELIQKALQRIESKAIQPIQTQSSSNGIFRFTELEQSLYLLTYRCSGEKLKVQPILCRIPMHLPDGSEPLYDLTVYPKNEKEPMPSPSPTPMIPQVSAPSPRPVTPPSVKDPYLPQTGPLRWPVFLLAGVGLILFAIGFADINLHRGQKNRKHLRENLLILSGVICLAIALTLTLGNQQENSRAAEITASVRNQLDIAIAQEAQRQPDEHSGTEEQTTEEIAVDIAAIEVDGNGYIGLLSIPRIGLEKLPIMEQLSMDNLRMTPCLYAGTPETSMVIAGHNYEAHFGSLKALQPGDTATFIDVTGKETLYRVIKQEILKPTEVERMQSDAEDMSLFTCSFSGAERVTVRFEKEG